MPDIDKYCDVMEEVKKRKVVIDAFISGKSSTTYKATTIECIVLQFRKILELIALGSLVINKEQFAAMNEEFSKCWNARLILRDIERLNPQFYPQPVNEQVLENSKFAAELKVLTSGFLTQDEFVQVYDKCNAVMHARNPFANPIDYNYYERKFPEWISKIMKLLDSHTIFLADQFYLIHMKESRDDKVHGYTFEINTSDSASHIQG